MTPGQPDHSELIHDWNADAPAPPAGVIELDDETLRDGLQGPSVTDPPIATKLAILHAMDELGIDTADVGLPGAGPRAVADVTALCKEIVDAKLKIRPNCAARTMIRDVEPIARISQQVGIPIEACLFIGSSAIRQYTEDWPLETLLAHTEQSIEFAVKEGLPVMYVTEDTMRAQPETIRRLYTAAIDCGVRRVCLTDTVGHATPAGARKLVGFVRRVIADTGQAVKLDWHGHRDRGLGLANTFAAIEAGADRVHGCALGIGERAGNTEMDLLLVNLHLLGWIRRDLTSLGKYCRLVSEGCGLPIPSNYPVVGSVAFETGTGVPAAAVIKALRKNDPWLADRVYSGVPALDFGFRQRIRIGHMSGKSNVVYWLEQNGLAATDEVVDRIFTAAKKSTRLLSDDELMALARGA